MRKQITAVEFLRISKLITGGNEIKLLAYLIEKLATGTDKQIEITSHKRKMITEDLSMSPSTITRTINGLSAKDLLKYKDSTITLKVDYEVCEN